MAINRILIVNQDQKISEELRRLIKALGSNFTVVAVPSGEEALLEIRTQIFDVLVTTMKLPGIDGLTLMASAKSRNAALKVILIDNDFEGKNKTEAAGADAVFSLANEPADFIDAIKGCLGLVPPESQDSASQPEGRGGTTVSECLSSLHQSLGAITSILLDNLGRIQAQAGELTDPRIVPPLIAAFSANLRVGRFLGAVLPDDVHYYSGTKYSILFGSVGVGYFLVEFLMPVRSLDDLGKTIKVFSNGVRDLHDLLIKIGIELEPSDQLTTADIVEDAENDHDGEELILDALLRETKRMVPGPEDVDAFWDSIAGGETTTKPQTADILTYDQAMQLGFGPKGEEE